MSSFVYFLMLIKIKSQVFSSFIFVLPKSKLGSYFLYPNPNLVFFSNLYFIVLGLFLRRLPYGHRGGITFVKLNNGQGINSLLNRLISIKNLFLFLIFTGYSRFFIGYF